MSSLGKLNLGDFEKGLILAVISAVLTYAYDITQTGTLNFDWKKIGAIALTAGIAYLLKNLGTGSGGQVLTNQPKEEVKK